MSTIQVELDDDVVALMRQDDQPLDKTARELIVMELYRRGTISSGKAAQLLDMSRLEFIRFSGKLGIPYIDMTPDEWAAEMRTIDEITGS